MSTDGSQVACLAGRMEIATLALSKCNKICPLAPFKYKNKQKTSVKTTIYGFMGVMHLTWTRNSLANQNQLVIFNLLLLYKLKMIYNVLTSGFQRDGWRFLLSLDRTRLETPSYIYNLFPASYLVHRPESSMNLTFGNKAIGRFFPKTLNQRLTMWHLLQFGLNKTH